MKIYYSSSTANFISNETELKEIQKNIEGRNHEVMNSWLIKKLHKEKNKLSSKERLKENKKMILNSDAMVLEVTTPSIGIGYVFGYALAHRKPILCLYKDKFNDEEISEVIKGESSSLIFLKNYNNESIGNILDKFFENLELHKLQKFNFVASKEIVDFIKQGAEKERKSASEFLRDLIADNFIRQINS
ncbi:MAG: hypothetical protein Q9M91_07685 [Candidatus Dojkabacteria bacterium]|nr:hypothetical protein [Candidatus Dojkabacteria bacterium]MDQ7021667.1 hypothetical protein [Candidatus Dojkabacteria bacterium]